ncbi:MAG: DUF3098 domain-containing protein [Bacteroidia bacterium]|nr:DUF3098 domain-containing protein [Bacteroidia bacterium]
MSKKNIEKTKQTVKEKPNSKVDMVFGKQNYVLTALAFLVLIIGFILMYGDKENIYSFRKITLAPIVVLIGFIIGVFAVMKKPKSGNGAD